MKEREVLPTPNSQDTEAIQQQSFGGSHRLTLNYVLHHGTVCHRNFGTSQGGGIIYRVTWNGQTSHRHIGTEGGISIIADSFYVKNQGRKFRQALVSCEMRQQINSPDRSVDIESKSHCPQKPEESLAVHLYALLPAELAEVKFTFLCVDVFTTHARLFPFRSASAKTCQNETIKHHIPNAIHPKSILSDHGNEITFPTWKNNLANISISVKYSLIRHLESKHGERCVREGRTLFKLHCS
jgi:hypothetical protein